MDELKMNSWERVGLQLIALAGLLWLGAIAAGLYDHVYDIAIIFVFSFGFGSIVIGSVTRKGQGQ